MKRFLTLVVLSLLLTNIFAAIYPVDKELGQIVEPDSNSLTKLSATLIKEEYDLTWLEKYVKEDARHIFNANFSQSLISELPYKAPIFSVEDNVVSVKDFETNKHMTLFFDTESKLVLIAL